MQIDKKKIYKVNDYTFENLISQPREQILQILEWRNNPQIRKYMYNKGVISLENHLKFVDSLSSREDVAYWLVKKYEEPIGVTNLTSINSEKSEAELGYYMIPTLLSKGNGVEFAYVNFLFAFKEIGCDLLFGGIDKHNIDALILDSYMGCIMDKNDLDNIGCSDVEFVKWTIRGFDFLNNSDGKGDFRNLVRFMKTNKEFFDNLRKYAGKS